MEFKTVGKSRQYEMAAEARQNLLIRFIIHFLFADHTHRMIDLFDGADSIFAHFNRHVANSNGPDQETTISEAMSMLG